MMNIKQLRIALLIGGTSPEREVSKSSGKSIYKSLVENGYNVKLIDPAYGLNQPANIEDFFAPGDIGPINNRNCIEAINSPLFDNVDLAFLGLHGKWSEDGTIQSVLELRGIKYTGSGVLASAIAMDKLMSKILFLHYGVNTPRWVTLSKNEKLDTEMREKIGQLGYPCIVKPNDQGSTIGLTVCKDESELSQAVSLALKFSDKALIEEYIEGHEVTVAIIDKEATPVLEIKPKHGFYDYECKYTHGMSQYIVPAEFPQPIAETLQQQALLAFNTIGCKGYGRLDFRVTPDFRTYCLEVNTLPGMTDTSLVPKMAKASGISFDELLERIITLAL